MTFYRKGNIVTFRMRNVVQMLDGQWVQIGTLKESMRPPRNAVFSETDPNANNSKVVVGVFSNGNVMVYCYAGGAAITHSVSDTHMYQV